MTDRFDPPTVREPAEPGRPNEARRQAVSRQRGGSNAAPGPTTRPPRCSSPRSPADPATTLQPARARIAARARPLTRPPRCSTAPVPADPPTRLQRPEGHRVRSPDGVLGELSDRFEPVPGPDGTARLGSGAEAEVWLVRDREQHRLAALKLYRPDPLLDPHETFDVTLRDRLADPSLRAHVPLLYGWGWARKAMARRCLGSHGVLRARFAQRPDPAGTGYGRMGRDRAAEVVRETVNALVFWEDAVQQRQIDLSPGNILVRREDPLDLVFSDFGGVRGIGLSQAIGELQVKVGYMAPEALGNGHHSKSPYWSLGMICYQLVMGRPVIADRNEDAFRIILATDDIDVSAVPDPRWRQLIEGLLTRSIDERWGPDQVLQWLPDGSPAFTAPCDRLARRRRWVSPVNSSTTAGCWPER